MARELAFPQVFRLSRLAVLLLGAAVLPLRAQELPTAAEVVAGDVTTSAAPGQIVVSQTSAYGIVDWGSFGIGAGGLVQFDNGAGATLNRVTGGAGSVIAGDLRATGSVYLVNPAGIVIGAGGVVDTGGRFVASSLDVANGDFLDGGDLTFDGAGGVVVNLGQVGSSGGDVALIAGDVVNGGSLSAPNGTVALGAGRQVLLRDAAVDDGLISVLVGAGDVTDSGAIRAAAAELRAKGGNVHALAGNTDAVIAATGVAKVKGRVFLTAGTGKVVAEKTVSAKDADGTGGGITVIGGAIDLAGSLSASGLEGGFVTVKAAGETHFTGAVQTLGGGFVELSGGHITYDGMIDMGGGTLLINPHNIEITDSNAQVLSNSTLFTTGDILTFLGVGNLILDTSSPDSGDAGTILVASALSWTGATDLTLLATGDVWIDADVQNNGSGAVTAVAGWDGTTAYDAATFAAADLATTTIFGVESGRPYDLTSFTQAAVGRVFIGPGLVGSGGAAFGSRFGATSVYGNHIELRAGTTTLSGPSQAYAQLGFHTFGGGDQGTVNNTILVRSIQETHVIGGSGANAYALIGNGGNDVSDVSSTTTATLTGDIALDVGSILLLWGSQDGADEGAYAMIGHGSRDPLGLTEAGDRSGALRIDVGQLMILDPGTGLSSFATIGHATAGGTIASDVTVTTGLLLNSMTDTGTTSQVDLPLWADLTHYGDVRLTLTNGDAALSGSTEFIDTEGASITSAGDLILQSAGLLTLGSDFFYGNDGAGGLVLAGATVDNQAGAGAFLDIGGGWALYATRPDTDSGVVGTLTPDALVYGVSFVGGDPFGPQAALGNVIYYSVTPMLITDDAVMTYGTALIPTTTRVEVGGVTVDAATFGFDVAPAADDAVVTVSGDGFINAGSYAAALYGNVAGTVRGYAETRGDLTVDRATLVVTLEDDFRTYDGTTGYFGAVSYAGFVGTDNDSLVTGPGFDVVGGDASGKNAGEYTVTALGAAESSGNYDFDYADTATLSIDRADLSVSVINTITKGYDGTLQAVLTPADYAIEGLVGAETVTILQDAGLYDDAHAGERFVTVDLADTGLWSFGGGGLLDNYNLQTEVTGSGQIDRASLSVTIIGTPTKVFDGTTTAVLTADNLQITGVAAGDDIGLDVTGGFYMAADPGAQDVFTEFSSDDYVVGEGTDLSNYNLTFGAGGPGLILLPTVATSPEEPTPVSFTPEEEPVDPEPPILNGTLEVIDTETTGRIVEEIQSSTDFCREFVDPEYAIDCLSDRLQSVADGLSAKGEYSEVRAALEDAAANLHALAVQNASAELSRSVGRATDGSGRTTGRPLTPVAAALLSDANAQAAAIIANTQLVLLRSAASSDRRRAAFADVGQVLGATTVLLRS